MFISNNGQSFHLWRKEDLVKHQKVSDSYETDCTLPVLLSQIKTACNSYKLKNEIRQILHLLYQHNKVTKKVYNDLIK